METEGSERFREAAMTKHDFLLQHFADEGQSRRDGHREYFGIKYPAAAMALLRLARQGLVHR